MTCRCPGPPTRGADERGRPTCRRCGVELAVPIPNGDRSGINWRAVRRALGE